MRFFWNSKAQVDCNKFIENYQKGKSAQEEFCKASIKTLEPNYAAFTNEKAK